MDDYDRRTSSVRLVPLAEQAREEYQKAVGALQRADKLLREIQEAAFEKIPKNYSHTPGRLGDPNAADAYSVWDYARDLRDMIDQQTDLAHNFDEFLSETKVRMGGK